MAVRSEEATKDAARAAARAAKEAGMTFRELGGRCGRSASTMRNIVDGKEMTGPTARAVLRGLRASENVSAGRVRLLVEEWRRRAAELDFGGGYGPETLEALAAAVERVADELDELFASGRGS